MTLDDVWELALVNNGRSRALRRSTWPANVFIYWHPGTDWFTLERTADATTLTMKYCTSIDDFVAADWELAPSEIQTRIEARL